MRIAPENEILLDGVINALFTKKASDNIDPSKLTTGILVELEHTSDPKEAEKIARDHLAEDENYYTNPKKKNWGIDEAKGRAKDLDKQASSQPMRLKEDITGESVDVFKGSNKEPHFTIVGTGLKNLDIAKIKEYLYEVDWTDRGSPGWVHPSMRCDGFLNDEFANELHQARQSTASDMSTLAKQAASSSQQQMDERKAQNPEFVMGIKDRYGKGKFIRIGNGISGGEVIMRSVREPGKIQVTSFTEDGTPMGHENYPSFEDALASEQRWTKVDHPVAKLADNAGRKIISAWEEATFEHPYKDELMAMPYAYVSPLRPMSGISIDGRTSVDKSGRIGVLYRETPVPIDKLESLSLVPATKSAIEAFATDYVAMLGILPSPFTLRPDGMLASDMHGLSRQAASSAQQQEASVFVLEDNQERIDTFERAFGSENVTIAKNVKEALNILRSKKFAKVFLDRDISSITENGEDVAWQMKQEKLCMESPVVIHSENTRGQKVMAKYLSSYHSNVTVTPFRDLKNQIDIAGGSKLPNVIAQESEATSETPRKWQIKVTFDDGDVINTAINGTQDEIRHHYLDQDFTMSDEKTTHRPIDVQFVEDLGDVPESYYPGNRWLPQA